MTAAPGTSGAEHRLQQHIDDVALVMAENDRLRNRVADLEYTVRILRVQLPLMPYAIGPNPDGPDPRWASTIPGPRAPAHDAASAAQGGAPTPQPGR